MGNALAAVESLYFSLQASLADMLAACQTDDQRNQIQSQYIAARQNYWKCINRTFHEDDPALQALVAEAKTVHAQVSDIDTQLGDITTVLALVKKAATLGSQIASMVITL